MIKIDIWVQQSICSSYKYTCSSYYGYSNYIAILWYSQDEYRTLSMVFKDVKKDYDTECANHLQIQQDLYTERESLKKVNQQLIEVQVK